jgi:chromosome segregation protein
VFFKRLEITGFKSFATKTVLDFLPGITVIVGPNGCGKSNILDAIRWCLGEHRARALRGQKMGDVIFSGSLSHKAQSMASVSLIINNEDRRLPLDFTEIQVGRKLHRLGEEEFESEYLLNRTACRLRQITDLFMDTGIGTNSYSVLEQGQVDFIISAKPSERRYLFDEAVGISKYRSRRDEALRKLERTEADLVRLTDLLTEIKSRLRSLKIQANRAERYKQLVAEVRVLERDLLLLGYRELLAEKQSVDRQYDDVNIALQGVIAQIAQLDQALMARQVELDRLDAVHQGTRDRRAEAAAEFERVQSRRALLKERIDTTEAQMRRDESQIGALKQTKNQLVERRERMNQQMAELTEELARLEAEHKERRAQFDELVRSQSNARETLAALRQMTRTATDTKTHHENERRIASLMKQQAEENRERSRGQLAEAQSRDQALADREAELGLARAAKQIEIERVRAEIERLDALQKEQAEQIRALEQQERETARRRGEVESRRQALRRLQDNFEGFYRGVKELMIAAQRGELRDVVGTVANLIESRPEDELAIETALASHVQDIIVEKEEAALAGVELLKQRQLGRATFLPLDKLYPPRRDGHLEQIAREPGVVGIGADIVRFDERLKPAIEILLGRAVVVEAYAVAQRLRDRGLRAFYVARDGTTLNPVGAVTGGHIKTSGLMGREREIRELGREAERLESQRRAVEAQGAELGAALEAAARERAAVAEALHAARNELAQLESDLRRASSDREETRRLLEQAQRELDRLAVRIAEYEKTILEHDGALAQSAERAADLEAQLSQVATTSEDQDAQVSALQESLAEMMAHVSGTRERLDAARARAAELDEEIADHDRRIAETQAELESLAQALDRAVAEIEGTGRKIEEVAAALAALDAELADRASEREAAAAEIQQLQHESHAVQRRRNEQQDALHEIDRRRAQCEVQLQNLGDQANEKFRKSLEEIAAEAGEVTASREQLVSEIATLRGRVEAMGEVNVIAIEEHKQLSERCDFLVAQFNDLEEAKTSLRKTIKQIDDTSTEMFTKGMAEIRERFKEVFRRLFGGGRADLQLTDPDDVLNSGIDIIAQPPGKQPQSITLLSGGEKALTAISLLFGIFLYRPSPFCILDEIDAPLDDANVERFKSMVLEFSKDVQFVIITHNKQTMALADTLYGVTMSEPGASSIVSVRFDQVEESELVG